MPNPLYQQQRPGGHMTPWEEHLQHWSPLEPGGPMGDPTREASGDPSSSGGDLTGGTQHPTRMSGSLAEEMSRPGIVFSSMMESLGNAHAASGPADSTMVSCDPAS